MCAELWASGVQSARFWWKLAVLARNMLKCIWTVLRSMSELAQEGKTSKYLLLRDGFVESPLKAIA